MRRPRLTAWRVAVALILLPLVVWLVWGVALWYGDSSSENDIQDVPLTTTER
jgi:hypothetical protein